MNGNQDLDSDRFRGLIVSEIQKLRSTATSTMSHPHDQPERLLVQEGISPGHVHVEMSECSRVKVEQEEFLEPQLPPPLRMDDFIPECQRQGSTESLDNEASRSQQEPQDQSTKHLLQKFGIKKELLIHVNTIKIEPNKIVPEIQQDVAVTAHPLSVSVSHHNNNVCELVAEGQGQRASTGDQGQWGSSSSVPLGVYDEQYPQSQVSQSVVSYSSDLESSTAFQDYRHGRSFYGDHQMDNLPSPPPYPRVSASSADANRATPILHPSSRDVGPLLFICSACDYKTENQSNYTIHLRRVHGRVTQCIFCNKAYNGKKLLAEHIAQVHQNSPNANSDPNVTGSSPEESELYNCIQCSLIFLSKRTLNPHIKSHDPNAVFKFNCTEKDCGYKSDNRSHYLQHQAVHVQGFPYPCSSCEMKFKTKTKLAVHELLHQKYTTHQCPVPRCSTRCMNERALKGHWCAKHLGELGIGLVEYKEIMSLIDGQRSGSGSPRPGGGSGQSVAADASSEIMADVSMY